MSVYEPGDLVYLLRYDGAEKGETVVGPLRVIAVVTTPGGHGVSGYVVQHEEYGDRARLTPEQIAGRWTSELVGDTEPPPRTDTSYPVTDYDRKILAKGPQ